MYIKVSKVRKQIEWMADNGTIRVDNLIYKHLDLMVEHEIERIMSHNKGKRFAKKTIELCPDNNM